MALDKNLNKLSILLQAMEEDHLSRSDFEMAFKKVLASVKKVRDDIKLENDANRTSLTSQLSTGLKTALTELDKRLSEFEKMTSDVKKASASDSRTAMRYIDQKIEDLILPEEYDDEEIVRSLSDINTEIENIRKSIPEQFDATEITERLDKVEDDIEELKKRPIARGGGGTSVAGIIHAFKYAMKTEEPVGDIDGANTTYTVSQPIFQVFAFSINGEVITQLPNYTFAGNTITFSSALPAAYSGKDFEVKYI